MPEPLDGVAITTRNDLREVRRQLGLPPDGPPQPLPEPPPAPTPGPALPPFPSMTGLVQVQKP